MDLHDAPAPSPLPDPSAEPAAAPAGVTPGRPARRWRHLAAGALAGGFLAAAVTVPVTIGVARAVGPDDTTSQAPVEAAAPAPTTSPQVLPDGSTSGAYGRFGGPLPGTGSGTGTGTTTSTETDATAEQSRGVVLVESTLDGGEAAGTGMVLDADGLVLTNYHVVEGSTALRVTVATTGEIYDATVVGRDATADVALLQLDDASDLATVTLDDDGDPALADAITAVGNAEGQGYLSAATGTVGAFEQSITTEASGSAAAADLTGLVETDAAVVGGYSGGPMLDAEGEVVGITTAASTGMSPTGAESYAVPIDDALVVVEQIESGDETATTQIGASAYLGVSIGPDLSVAEVEPGSPAADAGIGAGSTLTALDGTTTTTYDDLSGVLAGLEPGDEAAVSWLDADGTAQRATLTLGSSPVS